MMQARVGCDRHLLGLKGMDKTEIESILDRAAYWEKAPDKVTPVQPRQVCGQYVL